MKMDRDIETSTRKWCCRGLKIFEIKKINDYKKIYLFANVLF